MPILCRKKVHSLKNTVFSCLFFLILHEKPPAVMPIFDQITSILLKPHYIMYQKSQYNALFFHFFTEKLALSCPYFAKKTSILGKAHCSQVYILSKNVQSLKNTALMLFFQIFHEKLPAVKPIFGQKKRQFCQNYTILWAQKDNKMSFFPIFHKE